MKEKGILKNMYKTDDAKTVPTSITYTSVKYSSRIVEYFYLLTGET